MSQERDALLSDLTRLALAAEERKPVLQRCAALIRGFGGFRWVGLYDVDYAFGLVRNIVWSGPAAPEYPVFPISQGLTGAAIAQKQIVNIGNVVEDPRYLTAFGSTQSEIIVPVLSREGLRVVGTIDVESEQPDAFSNKIQDILLACSQAIQPLWEI